jgi:signal peptidase
MRWPLPWPKAWRDKTPPEEPSEEEDEEEKEPKSLREQAILFARDLLVAFIIVALVMAALFAYTRVWPPMVVVESASMQHSNTESSIGVIDTGDLVLVQTVGVASDIVTYVDGTRPGGPNFGYATYSNYGDVIIFNAPGNPSDATPIIHRAMVYVVPHDASDSAAGMDVPGLVGRPAGDGWSGQTVGNLPAAEPRQLKVLNLTGVQSWDGGSRSVRQISWTFPSSTTAGFLTKGDHNGNGDSWAGSPVPVARIVGKARGELPWFGLIKLTLSPSTTPQGCCKGWGDPTAPRNSWDSLLVSLVLIIVGPFAADFGWSFYKDWRKKQRKAAKAATAKAPGGDESPPLEPEERAEDATPPAATGDPTPTPPAEPTDEAQTGSAGPEGGGPEGP